MDSYAFLYVLIDPRIEKVFYVGTTYNLKTRLASHLRESKQRGGESYGSKKEKYIYSMLQDGVKPVMSVLEVFDYNETLPKEQYWVEALAIEGHPLTNRFGIVAGHAARIYEKIRNIDIAT
jgi:hypothetical protein